MVGALTGGIVNWTVDKTYSLESGLHALAVALADLLGADANGWMRPSGCCGKYRTRASRCDRSPSAPAFLMARSARTSRQRIHGELRRHVRTAPRSRAWPEVAETLEFGLVGALVHASCGADTFRQTAEGLVGMAPSCCPTARRLTPKLTFGRKSASESRQSVDLDRVRTYSPPSRCLGGHSNPQTNGSALEERRPPCASSSPGATAASVKPPLGRWPPPVTA
jgi:hypothetical protein